MKLQNIKLKMLSNFISSIKGWKIYHKIVHKYPLKRGLYILIPEMDEKLSFCAALYLNQLLLKKKANNAIFLSCYDSKIEYYSKMFTGNVKEYVFLNSYEINNILQFYRLYNFDERFLVASFSQPFGNNSQKILNIYPENYNELFALCIYKLKPYNSYVDYKLRHEQE